MPFAHPTRFDPSDEQTPSEKSNAVREFSAGYRSQVRGCPMHQVKQLEDLDA